MFVCLLVACCLFLLFLLALACSCLLVLVALLALACSCLLSLAALLALACSCLLLLVLACSCLLLLALACCFGLLLLALACCFACSCLLLCLFVCSFACLRGSWFPVESRSKVPLTGRPPSAPSSGCFLIGLYSVCLCVSSFVSGRSPPCYSPRPPARSQAAGAYAPEPAPLPRAAAWLRAGGRGE